ncbi:MAG: hypothetical protein ACR2KK_14485 [Acidimicrobiales bacterium]
MLRATSALATLGGLVVGVPVVLTRLLGWPLPRSVPRWTAVGDALGGASISDDVVIKTLAIATWVLWALIVASFVAESVAWMRGREARRLPLAGLLQPAVRELVVSAVLLFGALRPAGMTSVVIRPAMPALVSFPTPAATADQLTGAVARADAPTRPTCVVGDRDSLWKIAGRHLGDPMRWRDIWELNRGAIFPDGRRFANSNLIQPGWVLVMPDDAVGLASAGGPPPPAPAVPTPAPEPAAPPPDASSDVATQPAPAPSPPSEAQPTPAPAVSHLDRDDPDHDVRPLLASSALIAAGVIATLTRLRRRQQHHRRSGRMIRLPSGQAARTEVHLRRAAVGAPYDRLDLALRALAHSLGRRQAGPCPAISVLSVGPEAIEILLTEAVDAPRGPFDVTADGRAWTLPAGVPDDELRPLADLQSGPAPALVTVGTIDDRTVLIDLEAGARTIVGGDPDDAQALLWSMAIELATSNRADDLRLVLVGKPPSGIDVLDRVEVVDSLDEVMVTIESGAATTTATLAGLRRSSTFDARAADPTLLLTPTVVIVADVLTGSAFDRLMSAAAESHGLAVLAAGPDVDAAFDRELCVEADTLLVKPLGLRLRPAALFPGVVEDIGELLGTAVDLSPGSEVDIDLEPACHPPLEGLTIGPDHLPLTFDHDGNPVVPAGHVVVRVLGPVEIVGSERAIDRRRCIELVVYLALHPEGVDEGRIKAALWPESEPTRGAFNETVSRARRLLGLDPTGVHHLRPVDNRRYLLGPYVVTDADILQRSSGSRESSRLVRGLPLEGTSSGYEWAYEEAHAYRLSAIVEQLDGSAQTTRRGRTAAPQAT